MQKRIYLVASVVAVLVLFSSSAAHAVTCETYPAIDNFQAATRGNTSSQLAFNPELGDYGLIFEDSKWRDCDGGAWLFNEGVKHGAYEALLTKINTTVGPNNDQQHVDFQGHLVAPYQGWLEGGFVTLIFSSALMIGGHGDLDSTLDAALQKVEQDYNASIGGPGQCGFYQPSGWNGGGDTCMEEHVTAASAYAWMAAYESKRRGFMAGYQFALKANEQIAKAFSTYDSICISDKSASMDTSTRGPCNVDTTDASVLQSYLIPDPFTGITRGDILSFNRNENVLYGFGQLGQISSALIALSEGGYDRNSNPGQPSLTQGEQVIAFGLIDEAQRKAATDGSSFSSFDCAQATISGGSVMRRDIYNCSDTPPKAFAFNTRSGSSGWYSFFESWVTAPGLTPRVNTIDHHVDDLNNINQYNPVNNAFQFNQFDDTLFGRDVNFPYSGALNWGRESVYKVLGWTWNTIDGNRDVDNTWNPTAPYDRRPRLWAYNDDYNPKGYLDSIDANGVAYGWTCDQDQSTNSNKVDFYVDGGGLGTYVMRATANVASEPEVAAECGGGNAHRFQAQLPAWTKGHLVYAWGLDITWRGVYELPGWQCPNYPACTW